MTILAAGQGPGWCPGCGMAMGPWGWVWMILMGLVWIGIVAALLWLFYRIARTRGWIGEGPRDRAEEILRERYARGEIDRETYRRMLEELRRGRAA